MDKENKKAMYIGSTQHTEYFFYDEETMEVSHGDNKVRITPEKLSDFMHTAELLGFKAGTV